MKTNFMSKCLFVISSVFVLLVLLLYGFAIANAENTDTESIICESTFSSNDIDGIAITKENGEAASSPTDYEVETDNRIWIKTDNLTVSGTTNDYVNYCITVKNDGDNVKNLTLANLKLNCTSDHNVVNINCPSENQQNADDIFTLNIIGDCYLYQNCDYYSNLNNHAIFFDKGNNESNIRINGEEGSYLECFSVLSDTLYIQKCPLVFSGDLECVIYNEEDGGDAIDWENEDGYNNLTLTDNVYLGVGNTKTENDTAINVSNLVVSGNSSLVALSNNNSTRDMAVIIVRGKFEIDTTGDVIVDAYNAKSWQAIICYNNIFIKKCNSFTAIAKDYCALDVRGTIDISEDAVENIYLSGGFLPTDGRALRGAFNVEHPDRLVIPEGYLMYGSEEREVEPENINKRSVVTFSSGTDEFDVYTPVIPDWAGLSAPKYANSVVFREGEDLVYVPGVKPAYDHGGYRDCFKIQDKNVYFEDYEQTIPIENIMEWRSKDGNGFLASLSDDFDAYKENVLVQCDLMFERGDRPEIAELINSTKTEIENYVYDNSISLLLNKVEIDNIYKQLEVDTDALDLPLPEPWNPPSPVNPESNGAAQTGDSFPYWVGILLMLVAVLGVLVAWRKKEFIKNKLMVNGTSSLLSKTGFVAMLVVAVVVPMLFLSGVVVAIASTNNDDTFSLDGVNNIFFANQNINRYSQEPYPGISVTKDGQPATLDIDYAVDTSNQYIEVKNSGLSITGGTSATPIAVSVFTDQNVRDLTIDNLHIYSEKDSSVPKICNTLYIDWECNSGEEQKFTLNVKGDCGIFQTGSEGGCAIDIVNEQGNACNIHADEESSLYCFAQFYEAIFIHTGPLQISGDLIATLEASRDNCIGWREDAHYTDLLAITDNAVLTCYASDSWNYSAIEAGSFGVLNNASLYVVNNNSEAKNVPTINVKHFFGINTTGDAIIGNINERSWQAIKCETLSILSCNQFMAYSSDYCAIECTNSITIETPNVVICGEFNREQTDDRARRGAITIEDPNKIYISPDILPFGSVKAYDINDTNNLVFMLRTVGTDVSEDVTLYTPVICDGNFATIAKTITFARIAHNLELVPGSAPTYLYSGFRECYECNLCGYYFEDASCENLISDIEAWRSDGSVGYIAPLKDSFDPYRARMVEACNNMYLKGELLEIRVLVEDAQVQIQNYAYNDGMSMPANKAALDNIYYQLLNDVNNI